MIPLLISASSLLNFVFYIYAIGFVIALGLEQYLKVRLTPDRLNERHMYIVQTNRNTYGERHGLLILIGSYVT